MDPTKLGPNLLQVLYDVACGTRNYFVYSFQELRAYLDTVLHMEHVPRLQMYSQALPFNGAKMVDKLCILFTTGLPSETT